MTGAECIREGNAVLGIEFGSTRIKAVLIDQNAKPIATGAYDWENRFEDNIWTYTREDILSGLKGVYSDLSYSVQKEYGVRIEKLKAMGVSAMMHGCIECDENYNFLSPFRTWRNTITAAESEELTKLFDYPIPQRWTISHVLKDIKDGKSYLKDVKHVFTLASYVHFLLTGVKAIGIGDASGMFPIDFENKKFSDKAAETFISSYGYDIRPLFPEVKLAGEMCGTLTAEGVALLDESGTLQPGVPFCAPEGDAETGMAATNTVKPRTGNVSAGTSAFATIILEKPLSRAYGAIDIVSTPDGYPGAMAHSNNCTGDYDGWISLFAEVLKMMGTDVKKGKLYDMLLRSVFNADKDAGGIISYNFISGEHIVGLEKGVPMVLRDPEKPMTIANFMLSLLYSSLSSMRIGLDMLEKEEGVKADLLIGHGGFFKTSDVGLKILSSVTGVRSAVMSTAGEGGAWGAALLASYIGSDKKLSDYLDEIFSDADMEVSEPDKDDTAGYNSYFVSYEKGLAVERKATEVF